MMSFFYKFSLLVDTTFVKSISLINNFKQTDFMKKLVSFFEIPATDFERAIKFYETLLKTKLSVMDCGHEKMAFFSDESSDASGAISWAEGFNPSKDGVLISLSCEDIDSALNYIEKNEGKTLIPKTQIEADNAGFFAVFLDCEGNRVGLWAQK
jgi:predicted enzyme related to lactoylglutathione lyase